MSLIFKVIILLAGILTSFLAMSSSEQPDFFIHKFMDIEIKKNKSSQDKMESWSFISKKFIQENNINTETTFLNSYHPERYEIVGGTANFIDVKIFNESCISSGDCFGDHVLRLAIVHEDGHLAILPYGYKQGAKYLDFWWQNIQGKYEPLGKCVN